MARLACRGKQLRDELREQRARLLARAAPLEADVGAFFSPAVDAVAPAAARPWFVLKFFALVKFFSVSSQFYDGESLVEWTARLVNDF